MGSSQLGNVKGQRTVSFSKKDTEENIKIGPSAAQIRKSIPTKGLRYPGGSNRKQNVKMEFQMNKVGFIILFFITK